MPRRSYTERTLTFCKWAFTWNRLQQRLFRAPLPPHNTKLIKFLCVHLFIYYTYVLYTCWDTLSLSFNVLHPQNYSLVARANRKINRPQGRQSASRRAAATAAVRGRHEYRPWLCVWCCTCVRTARNITVYETNGRAPCG